MDKKNWIALGAPLVVAASLVVALPLGAQQVAVPKIAVINGERVIEDSEIGKEVFTQAQTAAEEWQARINVKREEVDGMVRQAQEQSITLNADAMARLRAEIEQGQVDLQRLNDDANRALDRLQLEAQDRINAQLIPAVERLAQQDGYDLILDSRITGMLYFSNSIDATDQFIELVNTVGSGTQQGGSR